MFRAFRCMPFILIAKVTQGTYLCQPFLLYLKWLVSGVFVDQKALLLGEVTKIGF